MHSKLVAKNDAEVPQLTFHSCLLSNISQCEVTEQSENFVVTLYNPLAQETTQYVRLPVQNFKYLVFQNGEKMNK
jgi:lysosomal alpha-mannosidase